MREGVVVAGSHGSTTGPGVCDIGDGVVGLRGEVERVRGSEGNRRGKGGGSEEGEKTEVGCGVVQSVGTSSRPEMGVVIEKYCVAG